MFWNYNNTFFCRNFFLYKAGRQKIKKDRVNCVHSTTVVLTDEEVFNPFVACLDWVLLPDVWRVGARLPRFYKYNKAMKTRAKIKMDLFIQIVEEVHK